MLFNSLDFAAFLAVCLPVYFLLSHRAQNCWLLLASYVFYAAWDWRFLGLLLVSTVVDYWVALLLAETTAARRRKLLLWVSICTNLGILGFFKYFDFFAESLRDLLAVFGLTLHPLAIQVVLPVGISFYSFQTLSYTIDVYRGVVRPARSALDFALYVAFFPQLVAGPIERASHLLPQVIHPREPSWEGFGSGSWLVLWGLFKKVVIADNLAHVVDAVYAPGATPAAGELVLATYAFTYQIYCDFSGYTDIARGVGRMLGFDIMLNFDLPYWATDPADYWRRWHISLSTWLRDYLYVPLGGNRYGRLLTYRNLAITMVLGGLWHGAAWPFVLWGAYHGALLIAQRALQPWVAAHFFPVGRGARAAWRVFRVGTTFHLVAFGLLIFRSDSVRHIGTLLGVFAEPFRLGSALVWLPQFAVLVAPLLLMELAQGRSGDQEIVTRWPLVARVAIYTVLFFTIVVLGEDDAAPFIYFQF